MSLWSICCPSPARPPLSALHEERVDQLAQRVDQLQRVSDAQGVRLEEMQRTNEKLERRIDGFMISGAAAVGRESTASVAAVTAIDPVAEARAQRHKSDAELGFESGGLWDTALANDWQAKEKGTGLVGSLLVSKCGIGQYDNYEVADAGVRARALPQTRPNPASHCSCPHAPGVCWTPQAKYLLVQHVNTALHNGDGRGVAPAVWGRAFTAAEFREAESAALRGGATLIKRMPEAGDTVGGLCFNTLERAPRKGERIHVPGYRLECIDVSGSRITRVHIAEDPNATSDNN